MKTIKGDIFKGEWNGMVHCANLYHTFGAGVARIIADVYPEAYDSDCLTTKYGDPSKLGYYSYADIDDKTIFNLYGQEGIGNDGEPINRNVRYDHIHDGLYRVCEHIDLWRDPLKVFPYILAMPMMGCGLAGGEWSIVEAIVKFIEKLFDNIEIVVYHL